MEIEKIVEMYNVDGLSTGQIANHFGVSKSTISRNLIKNGYILDKDTKQYLRQTEIEGIQETINTGNNKNVNIPISKNLNTVKCTFDLPQELHKRLKVKCAIDGVKMVDYVRELLEKSLK